MNDIQTILTFLQKYSVDVLVFSAVICLFTNLIKKIIPECFKTFVGLLPFVFGVIIYAVYSCFLHSNFDIYFVLNKGIQCGSISTLIYVFYKQLLVKNGDINSVISNILKGIIASKNISEVAKLIAKHFDSTISEEESYLTIKQILSDTTDMTEDVKEVVANLIVKTLTKTKN